MSFDIVVIGAGPAGLCFARSLAGSGLRIALVERQEEAALIAPADDGREIAITHHSQRLLRELGLWARLHQEEIGTLRDAMVLDGDDRDGLMFRHDEAGREQLGWLLSNHAIRRAAYEEVMTLPEVERITGARVGAVRTGAGGAEVGLDNGDTLRAQLVVAADSRFSDTRRSMGIGAEMRDFGKTMLVLRMRHQVPHGQVAWEWFGHGQTLALLPLHDPHTSSVVLTLAPPAMRELLALDDAALEAAMAERFGHRLGTMTVAGPRCTYPLVGVYAKRFVAERFALIGDAAVGMHPVTAHGFNFGLLGQDLLARELRAARAAGQSIAAPALLARYERRLRLATRPLYLATNLLAGLYTDDRGPARVLRKLALGAGARLGPFRRLVMSGLTAEHGGMPAPLRRLRPRIPA
ncbi:MULTISPECIES: 5-demethoxyubiquinol-8 5-hydroxylase UbiM [unclassified Rhodanobacter]|uniref:5-demethoxyubiquinol-8 5-hydroxylase UbiM n=1 Tax=unclassified Rhodanobacter TaxID=2621553 RepID=UPI001BE0BD31|nr:MULTISPECIES: 5-demethoxyubiquinol-8 5-hydroxylase UbiM [unclassified Rhodanobacter]MBT2144818.1 5-demethoxyubiquinol-8 5-hydroxylase UbiM [Rhodanobacter sp. LX-99]MBT2148863.1 5-demethoxyubiquinol-8 5-hydroxylase UbiM [Rhodanobacter sp. LX-100]